jgi:hypothetical protein
LLQAEGWIEKKNWRSRHMLLGILKKFGPGQLRLVFCFPLLQKNSRFELLIHGKKCVVGGETALLKMGT